MTFERILCLFLGIIEGLFRDLGNMVGFYNIVLKITLKKYKRKVPLRG